MSLLEEFSSPEDQVSLDAMYAEDGSPKAIIPSATVRAKASEAAILSGQVEETYRKIFGELSSGETFSYEQESNKHQASINESDEKLLVQMLGDPTLSIEQKQKAVDFLQESRKKRVPLAKQIVMKAASDDSPGENREQEMMRTVSASEMVGPMYEYRKHLEELRNAHGASLNSETGTAVNDFLELIVPFSVNKTGGDMLSKIKDEIGVGGSWLDAIAPGEAMVAIREALANTPVDQRAEVSRRVIDIIKSHSGNVISDDNDFIEYITAEAIFEEDGYGNVSRWLDNLSGLLDIVGIGAILKPGKALVKGSSSISRNAAVNPTRPTSVFNSVGSANPERGREMFSMIVQSEGDELSEALTGVGRSDAIMSSVAPQAISETGEVAAKVPAVQKKLIEVDPEAVRVLHDDGGIYITQKDKQRALANITNDIHNAKGLTIHDNMVQVGLDGNRVQIRAVYGTDEGGFLRAEDAISQAKFSLREYPIGDGDITILKRTGDVYDEVPLDLVKGVDGDYMVQVKINKAIDPTDVAGLESLDVKRNFFDRIPSLISTKAGSISRHLLDASSMLSKSITGAAEVAVDRAVRLDKVLLKEHDEFAKMYMGLEEVRRAKVYEYLKEANFKGIELSEGELVARGFTGGEISAINKWRKAWDTHFFLENRDLARTLSIKGFKLFDDGVDRFFVKPVTKINNPGKVYDASLGVVRTMSKEEIDGLYDAGGTLARFRSAENIDGDVVEYMMVHNTPGSYARAIRETDQVLNYRKGYYQIQYNAPRFIIKKVRDKSGNVMYEKAIGVAGNTQDAERFLERQARMDGVAPEDWGFVRGDRNQLSVEDDVYWDLQKTSGRIAQRRRGESLENASGTVHVGDSDFIADPVESAIRAARSISGRATMRESLEFSKIRAMQQFEKVFPKSGGRTVWPRSAEEIGREQMHSKLSSDARTTWEYLNYLENGYHNSIDEAWKALSNGLADFAGSIGLTKTERAMVAAGSVGPLNKARSAAFHAYIGTNPLRQLIIQPHQIVRTLAYDPVASVQAITDGRKYLAWLASGKKLDEQDEVVKFIRDSGMLDAVDRHNLVRASLSDMAESTSKGRRVAGKTKRLVLDTPRKYGFDLGEQVNLLHHMLTVRRRFINQGRNLSDKAVRDEAYAEARALSYSMNYAGDMPYNQNFMNAFLQFMQVPHKAIMQVTTNRRLTPAERTRLAMFDATMWGIPAVSVAEMLGQDILPEDKVLRDTVVHGLEDVILNKVINMVTGSENEIDFSSLAPYDLTGWGKFMTAMWEDGLHSVIINSPSGQLFTGNNPRITNSIRRMSRFFGYTEDPQLSPATMTEALGEVAKISSGFSNAFKASIILEQSRIADSKGYVLKDDASNVEAIAQMFGFQSKDVSSFYELSRKLSEDRGGRIKKNDVQKLVDEAFYLYQNRMDEGDTQTDLILNVTDVMFRVFKDPADREIVMKEVNKRLKETNYSLIPKVVEYAKLKGSEDVKSMIKRSSLSEDEKSKLLDVVQHILDAKNEED